MPLVAENWQTTRSTIRERTIFVFNNDLFSDVKFVVRQSDGESESKHVIPAHKFVLSIGSPVFEAMFYRELAETRDSIELPDCEYESLLELFRYMYSDEVNLSGSNVFGVLYLAKKYMVPSLADKCTEYLQNNLDPSSVFSILPSAQKLEEENLVERCWELIDKQTEAAVKSDGFATIERSLLETLVERDTLDIAEVELFKGVVEWATKETEKRGIVADEQEMRKIVGERIIKAIRFPVMKQEEFASVVLDTKILTYDEVTDIIKLFNSVTSSPVGFPASKRSGPFSELMRCPRFTWCSHGWKNEQKQLLCFSVDRDILFHGVNLFGSKNNTYSVALTLSVYVRGFCTIYASTEGTFCSLPNSSGKFYAFDVPFEEPIPISKGEEYLLTAQVTGPESWYGTKGHQTSKCSGVSFTMKDILMFSRDPKRTSPERGQFNEFIFSIKK